MCEPEITIHTLSHYHLARRMGFTATAEALLEILRSEEVRSTFGTFRPDPSR